ncbi:MAG: hypothetical protein ACTHJS_14405, partial [Xanthobacteraceae bacterium]
IAHKELVLECVMSKSNLAAAAAQICSAGPLPSRSLGARIMDSMRAAAGRFAAWRKYRREREELHALLASDHRIGADIGYRHHKP